MKRFQLIAVALAAAVLLTGCGVNPDHATRALEAQGLTDVNVGGFAIFGCGENDTFRSTFTATGANGKPVSGVVCSALFKGTTVRYD